MTSLIGHAFALWALAHAWRRRHAPTPPTPADIAAAALQQFHAFQNARPLYGNSASGGAFRLEIRRSDADRR